MAMVSLLVLGTGLSASDNSLTEAITQGSKNLLRVEAIIIPLALTVGGGSKYIQTTWHNNSELRNNTAVMYRSDTIPVPAIIAAIGIPAIGVAGTGVGLTATGIGGIAACQSLKDLDLSPYVGKNAEAGIFATAATGLCMSGLAFTGIHPAASTLPCATLTAAFVLATGFDK